MWWRFGWRGGGEYGSKGNDFTSFASGNGCWGRDDCHTIVPPSFISPFRVIYIYILLASFVLKEKAKKRGFFDNAHTQSLVDTLHTNIIIERSERKLSNHNNIMVLYIS